jgi:predicted transcriptional regulator
MADDARMGDAMEIETLRDEMHSLFEEVSKRFEQVDQRFEQVDQQFEQVQRQFGVLSAQIATEAENTRRHFDIVVEQLKAERNLALDQSMAVADRLDDHERRITKLERRK